MAADGAGDVTQPKTLSMGRHWWLQFPAALRELTSVRLVACFGAGGILYLTPMVEHRSGGRRIFTAL